jgi:hypothetical protein
MMKVLVFAAFLAFSATGCIGTTGGDLVTFEAAAAGPADAIAGQPLAFSTPTYRVRLDRAKLHIGALYLGESIPVSGVQATSCILPGTYVAEITQGLDVDLLSPVPQRFPVHGQALSSSSRVGEVWLNHGDVDQVASPLPVFLAEGTAERGGAVFPFVASISIGANRAVPSPDPARPGANHICKERIVSPIPAELLPSSEGAMLLRIDPRILFQGIDFAALTQVSEDPPLFRFDDAPTGPPSIRLYQTLRSARSDLYRFEWTEGL